MFVCTCVYYGLGFLPPSCKLQWIKYSTFGTMRSMKKSIGPLRILHRRVTAVFDSHLSIKPSTWTRPLPPLYFISRAASPRRHCNGISTHTSHVVHAAELHAMYYCTQERKYEPALLDGPSLFCDMLFFLTMQRRSRLSRPAVCYQEVQ